MVSVTIVFVCVEAMTVTQFFELHRLQLQTSTFWLCQFLLVLGTLEFCSGFRTLALGELKEEIRSKAIKTFSRGILLTGVSLIMQAGVWETIERARLAAKP